MKTGAMKDQTTPALVPKLRFPEFRNEDAWQVKPLNKLLFEPKKRNRDLELGPADVLSVSGEHGCVNQIEFMGRSYAGASVKDYHVVEHGDVVYTKSPLKKNPFGIIKANKGKRGIVSTLYAVYRPFPDCSATYLDHFFSGDYNLNAYLQPLVKKGAKNDMKVNNTDVLKGNICVPKLPEQQKIADCLDSLDELIAAQGRKVESLKTHKKGLMQQLFPREGETQPRLRFPEFQDAGDWECATLAEVAQISSGSTPLRSNAEFFDGGIIPWVKTTDLNNAFISQTEECITPKARARVNPIGSVLVAMYGGFNQIGRTGCLSVPAATNQALSALVLDKKRALPAYVLAWLNAKVDVWKRIASSSRKDPNITGTDVARFPIALPSPDEQQRIADCLRGLDTLIAAATQTLGTLKTHKQGLMQQLFPSTDVLEA
jgi:type I restriction enzyme, S subunit